MVRIVGIVEGQDGREGEGRNSHLKIFRSLRRRGILRLFNKPRALPPPPPSPWLKAMAILSKGTEAGRSIQNHNLR
jgi:hypothetical protein